ncbi:MAG: M23 family metallopeptidase [Bacteroidales bacterium]|nr:M23 family metallopeptidase [Bacteroidales bacterium]
MPKSKKYIFNAKTLSYEIEEKSKRIRLFKFAAVFCASVCLAVLYFWIYTVVLGNDLPKTAYLRHINEAWSSRIDIIENNLDEYDSALTALQIRDDEIYRSLFGMNTIPAEVRNAGFGGVNRYSYLDGLDNSAKIRSTVTRIDVLSKKSYIQSKSFDEVAALSKRAGDMVSCIPKISPIVPDNSKYRLSSGFGVRTDPVYGGRAMHSGLDFAMPIGNPVYSTGDGIVEKVTEGRSGYGNNVVVDHGFGYKTRYAHLSEILVEEGMAVKRGDTLGKTGNSGKSSGPHLHYEVIYKGRHVNPVNYLDLEISPEEYSSMLEQVGSDASGDNGQYASSGK